MALALQYAVLLDGTGYFKTAYASWKELRSKIGKSTMIAAGIKDSQMADDLVKKAEASAKEALKARDRREG